MRRGMDGFCMDIFREELAMHSAKEHHAKGAKPAEVFDFF